MDNIELYINGALCDTGDDFNVRLNRQLIVPSGLNTKNAQYSYTLSLPLTPANSKLFGYADVEETKNKFSRRYTAELIVNSHLVFKGNFRLSEITPDSFKGNLYLPAPSEIKAIFGSKKLNESPPLYLSGFTDPLTAINRINKDAATQTQECIFPMVLYGIIPKDKVSDEHDRHHWNADSYWTYDRLLPSPNVLRMLKHQFNSRGYQLNGNVFDDECLTSLYMSYHNPPEYRKEWNWGDINHFSITGKWANYKKSEEGVFSYENEINLSENEYGKFFSTNLLNAGYTEITKKTDTGSNIETEEASSVHNSKTFGYNRYRLSIPMDGYYKIALSADFGLAEEIEFNGDGYPIGFYGHNPDTGTLFTGVKQYYHNPGHTDNYDNTFDRKRYEIQLLRNFAGENFNGEAISGYYNAPQFNQDGFTDSGSYPRYYPQAKGALMVDSGVNPNFICGLHWGANDTDFNPADTDERCNYMIVTNGQSWDSSKKTDDRIRCAYNSYGTDGSDENYWRYDSYSSYSPVKARCGRIKGAENKNAISQTGNLSGKGYAECVIWLKRGEEITLNFVGDRADLWQSEEHKTRDTPVPLSSVAFDLTVTPFHPDQEWCNFDIYGNYNAVNPLRLTDSPYPSGKIDLVRFLPSDISIDEFIDNFCKAFNLLLTQTGEKSFSLNKKENKSRITPECVDLDLYADVQERTNRPLELPARFEIGFAINTEEEGYATAATNTNGKRDDGGGHFTTKALGGETIEQQSNFSYNWFKEVVFDERNKTFAIPVISKEEVWKWDSTLNDYTMTLGKAMEKSYTDLPIRFWYYGGQLPFPVKMDETAEAALQPALVSNTLPEKMTLCYENRPQTILTTYFSIATDADSHYTEVECYLTPEEFDKLNGARQVKFNGDRYYISEICGFDPLGKSKTKLKLIKIVR